MFSLVINNFLPSLSMDDVIQNGWRDFANFRGIPSINAPTPLTPCLLSRVAFSMHSRVVMPTKTFGQYAQQSTAQIHTRGIIWAGVQLIQITDLTYFRLRHIHTSSDIHRWLKWWPWFNIKITSYQHRDSHVKDKTVSSTVLSLTWESPYLGKTVFILRRDPFPLVFLTYLTEDS